ncbi:MAG TPA: type II secretion system F family protein [Desulfuromonadaceae bacterium]
MFIAVSIFASVALLTGAILYPLLSRRDAVRERVAKLIQQEQEQPALVPTRKKWQVLLADMGGKLRMKPADLRTYREMVTAAGFRKESVYIFLGSKLLLATALPAAYLTLFALPQVKMTSSTSILIVVAAAISGYLLPTFWLTRRAENRKTEIFHSLPDVLDLLTVCVEAGLSLDAGLIKTTENFQHKNNPLIKEINTVTLEVRAGKPRSEALKGLAERTMVEDIKSFVSMLVQTEKFGTSLGKTLRTYSDSLRMKRKQLAEERAAKTAVKMLLPLTFCVFPALLVVMLVPAFFKIYAMFNKH